LLSTTITFQGNIDENIISELPYSRKKDTNHYQFFLTSADKAIGELELSQNKIEIQYSGELLFAEYMILHDIILRLKNALNGVIDDSNSFLGYLPNGDSVYIIKNWDEWVNYIQQSMTNCQHDVSSL